MSVSLQKGWINGNTVHTGSRPGKGGQNGEGGNYQIGKYMANAYNMGYLLPQAGYNIFAYGDGDAGTMGAAAQGAIDGGADVTGVTLPFFAKAQGEQKPGAKPSIIQPTMGGRMGSMRGLTQAAIAIPGSLGTLEETFEWVCSRNSVVYPQIVVSLDGYYDPLREFLNACAANGFCDRQGDAKRIHLVPTNSHAIERLDKLNAEPPEAERHGTLPTGRWDDYITETKHSMIVLPNPLNVTYQLLARLVSYDVANIPGQTLFQSEGNIIKPAIFVHQTKDTNEKRHFAGLQKQLKVIFDAEFMPREREQFLLFADDEDMARDMANELDKKDPLTPDNLTEKHAEFNA